MFGSFRKKHRLFCSVGSTFDSGNHEYSAGLSPLRKNKAAAVGQPADGPQGTVVRGPRPVLDRSLFEAHGKRVTILHSVQKSLDFATTQEHRYSPQAKRQSYRGGLWHGCTRNAAAARRREFNLPSQEVVAVEVAGERVAVKQWHRAIIAMAYFTS